jgi:hypothetical protein
MSNKIIIISLDIKTKNFDQTHPFRTKPFSEQLKKTEDHIRLICEKLKHTDDEATHWIIALREYGLIDSGEYFITQDHKMKLKDCMQQLTKDYPKLTVICPIASKKLINLDDKSSIDLNNLLNSSMYSLEVQKLNLMIGLYRQQTQSNYLLIRNITFIFSSDSCITKHEKIIPFCEAKIADSVFRPGMGKSQFNSINQIFGVEICAEHYRGALAHKVRNMIEPCPMIQIILSASTRFVKSNWVSPYAIHIDSVFPTKLYSKIDKAMMKVELYSYDLLCDAPTLVPIEPEIVPELFPTNLKMVSSSLEEKTVSNLDSVKDDTSSKTISTPSFFKGQSDGHAQNSHSNKHIEKGWSSEAIDFFWF